jgi:putative nucleotidyltransferase with HDIG domain
MALTREEILDRIKNTKDLPSFPDVVEKLMRETAKKDVSIQKLAEIIRQDTSLAAVFLRIANSAFYAANSPATDVVQAVTRLGVQEVRRIGCGAAVLARFSKFGGPNPKKFWLHSITVAVTAQVLFELSKIPIGPIEIESTYVAGLLHDLGILAFATVFPQRHLDIAYQLKKEGGTTCEKERANFGIDHGEIGEALARQWKLPDMLVDSIRYHHEPQNAPEQHRKLVALINLSDLIANSQGFNREDEIYIPTLDNSHWAHLGLSMEDVPTILNTVRLRTKRLQSVFT